MTVKCSVENTSLVVFAGVNMDSRFKGLLLFIISWEGWVRTVCCQDEQRLNRCYKWHCQEKTPQVLQSSKNVDLKHGIALYSTYDEQSKS